VLGAGYEIASGAPRPAAPAAGLSKPIDLRLMSRLEFGSGAVAMRYEPRR
jgi:hypothetical protein